MIFVVESSLSGSDTLFASKEEAQAEVARIREWGKQNHEVYVRIRAWDHQKDSFSQKCPDHQGIAPGLGQERCKRIRRKVYAYWAARDQWWNDLTD
jgi:hypothetical protein